MSTIPPKKLKINAYTSVKKNSAARDPLITAGWMLVTNKNRATGIPPNVVNPFNVPETIPVKIFERLLLILWFEYPFINKIEKKIIITHTYRWVVCGDRYFNKYRPIGDPITIPIKSLKTKFQSILFHM